jgi:hypothetical protein
MPVTGIALPVLPLDETGLSNLFIELKQVSGSPFSRLEISLRAKGRHLETY